MRRVFHTVLKESQSFFKECLRFIWSLCIATAASAAIFVAGIAVIIALFIFMDVVDRIIPEKKVVVDENELRLIEKNSKILEESFVKNCTESKEYKLIELVPFEWDKVYFIEALGKLDSFNPAHDYNTDAKKIIKKAGYDWGGRIPDMVDLDRPYSHTHLLFMNGGKVAAYLPYNRLSVPVIIRLHNWSEGEFESKNSPEFYIDIKDSDAVVKSFVLTP